MTLEEVKQEIKSTLSFGSTEEKIDDILNIFADLFEEKMKTVIGNDESEKIDLYGNQSHFIRNMLRKEQREKLRRILTLLRKETL